MMRATRAGECLAGFSELVAELKRRRVFRALVGWGIFSFAVLQVVEPVLHAFRLPEWTLTGVVAALAAGFPVTVALSWAFDLTSKGIVRSAPAAPGGAGPSGLRVAGLIAAVGLAAAAPGLVYFFVWPGAGRSGARASREPAGTPAAPSIAVLAFADLSPGKDQEYFSDGIAEEILNALARVNGLKVAGRTSSFHFKGRNEDLHAIGAALGVDNVLEGSVRKQGNRVRITAQLVRTADGFHRWSKTFDGDLTDVFELQERIARAITAELKVVLSGGAQERLVPVTTSSPEAYALYLQASAIFSRREGRRFPDAMAQLEQALRLDPGFARAHSRLAALNALAPAYVLDDPGPLQAAAERHARRALELDPGLAEPHAVLGLRFTQDRRFAEAKAAFRRALEIDPDDVTANFWYGTALGNTGYFRESNAVLDRVLSIDPILPNALLWRAQGYLHSGDLDAAERLSRRASDLGLAHAGLGLSAVAEARGDRETATRELTRTLEAFLSAFPPGTAEAVARGAYGDAEARARGLAVMDAYLATRPAVVAGSAVHALFLLGQPGRALELMRGAPTRNDAALFGFIWGIRGRSVRSLPEFPEFLRRVGLADFWERNGPPDECRRVGPRDYRCE